MLSSEMSNSARASTQMVNNGTIQMRRIDTESRKRESRWRNRSSSSPAPMISSGTTTMISAAQAALESVKGPFIEPAPRRQRAR